MLTRYIPLGAASRALRQFPLPIPTYLKVGQAFAKKGADSAGSSGAVHLNLEKRSARLCP
ncbi:hypothetical protein [Paenibacillus polymyxa]|uniref:hypothetical protein n=2 Tax=Paenibacillus TaxID=44249 RepID=UPI002ED5A63F